MIQPMNTTVPTSVYVLVLTNLVPIFGVLYFGWDLFSLLLLYWLENGVVGFYNIFKIILAQGKPKEEKTAWSALGGLRIRSKFILAPLFVFHFGGFMLGHLIALVALFLAYLTSFTPEELWGKVMVELAVPVLLLFWSHGFSFFTNFIGRQEYQHVWVVEQMMRPYQRIIVMHITIIAAAFATKFFGHLRFAIVILVLIKTFIDVQAHVREHTRPTQ